MTKKAIDKRAIRATIKQVMGWIKEPPFQPKLILITQELAVEMLKLNPPEGAKQRRMRWRKAGIWAHLMAEGLWNTTHQGLAFDLNGIFQDGQHRLSAVVQSGVPQVFWVFFGQPPENFKWIDMGSPRNAADIMGIEGVPNAQCAAAITREVNIYDSNGHRGGGFSTLNTPDAVYQHYLKLGADGVQDMCRLAGLFKRNKLPYPSTMGALALIASRYSNGEAVEFFESVASGANLRPRSLEKKLRDHLLRDGGEMRHPNVTADVIATWNAKRTRRRTVQWWSKGDEFPRMA